MGLVDPDTDRDLPSTKYDYDPHLDPTLIWTSKSTSDHFEVDAVSLHQHERIDPATIIDKVLKAETSVQQKITFHFQERENNLPLRDALQFYKHSHNWSNRIIAGDSLTVMNSLLQKEDLAGKVQSIYIDPPYGIEYKSNFQPFVNKTKVKDGDDNDLTQEPEMIKAYRDTWKLKIHSYLSYLRDRFILARELLHETGSCGVQISDENLHYVRIIMDEIFGHQNFVSIISFRKTSHTTSKHVSVVFDYIVWYAKDKNKLKSHKLYSQKSLPINDPNYKYIELKDEDKKLKKIKKTRMPMSKSQRENPRTIPAGSKIYRMTDMRSQGKSKGDTLFEFEGKLYSPGKNRGWSVSLDGLKRLSNEKRIIQSGSNIYYVRYFNDSEYTELQNMWYDTGSGGFEEKIYAVQTTAKVIRRFILMTTDPGDLVLDPTCGSGTTASVAEEFGRRWITCDTSRVALALAKKRLMTSIYKYYKLAYPDQGVDSGFLYKTTQSITLKSVAYGEDPPLRTLYDQPIVDAAKARVSGPFTMEAVPSPTALSLDTMYLKNNEPPLTTSESIRQAKWREELDKTGVIGKNKQKIEFVSVEPHPATRWIHAKALTKDSPQKFILISFGPAYAPLEQRQVENAIQEIRKLKNKPDLLIFVAFQFDSEAAKDIDELDWPGIIVLKAQMSGDILVGDLKRNSTKNESFMLMGRPDASLIRTNSNKYKVQIHGFDYYNTIKNKIESGNSSKIAMWMLDTDYDERSLYPQQIFFPMNDFQNSWGKIAKSLKQYVDEDLIEKYSGTESLEFTMGSNKKVAVKIIDDRGVDVLRILEPENDV